MANLRLVAYRKAVNTDSLDTTYELELQENPAISLNFQFSDIKEPETRKGSYSQTFKLPFTNKNNEFFQNWFNVNLETLVFTSRKSFDAVLYVGTVPQFEGYIQLKSVYQKAGLYEIVLFSNTASLFSVIGDTRLKDVFLNADNVSYSYELNHTFNETNMAKSWDGTAVDFYAINSDGSQGASLRDSVAGVQKVMYPMSVTQPNFYYDPNDTTADGHNKYLAMDGTDINGIGVTDASAFIVPISQFKPAIQLKELFKLIIAKAGFSYTSTFIDGAYFGKLFMTTCGYLGNAGTPGIISTAQPGGVMSAGNSTSWGSYTQSSATAGSQEVGFTLFEADTDCVDGFGAWNTTYMYFTKLYANMTQIEIKHEVEMKNIEPISGTTVKIEVIVEKVTLASGVPTPTGEIVPGSSVIIDLTPNSDPNQIETESPVTTIDISQMGITESGQIKLRRYNFEADAVGNSLRFNLGKSGNNFTSCDLQSKVKIIWDAYNTGIYGNVVDIPTCIDENITQKGFLKDIIERFNLVLVANPDDPTNILIETYDDYLNNGESKYWTDKIDISKEIIVKDTTELQKKTIHLTDQEDVDLANKEFKENYPRTNVYGHIKIDDYSNDFATGELKNNSIFSPFINNKVYRGWDTQSPSFLNNMTVQYEFTYNEVEGGVENKLEPTKSKLFYYCGTPTTVKSSSDNTITYYLHDQNAQDSINPYSFTTYPVCSPFDITPSSNAFTLSPDTKSLYWNANPPLAGELNIFNYNGELGSWFSNALYGLYWRKYLLSLYSTEARIMECHLNLNEVDIYNVKFNDEIFIKDSYWRILKISNYQVGGKVSTKVTLLKMVDELGQLADCNYVLGEVGGSNIEGGFYLWCPEDNPGCTPDITSGDLLGIYANPICCENLGGTPAYIFSGQASNGLYPCQANTGSMPINLRSVFNDRSILDEGQLKSILSDKFGGLKRPLIRGSANNKFNTPILPYFGDDIIIKYQTARAGTPQLNGESHRIVLSGFTEGNTRSFAYPEGDKNSRQIYLPADTNTMIRINGIVTVVGGTSATYTLGVTEAFAYYTAFKNVNGTVTQLSTAGGQQEFSIREGSNPTTCTLNIATGTKGLLQFGLDDSQTDTKRVWQLSIDLSIQRLHNLGLPYDTNWALYQNGDNIQFQNFDLMIWN
tara:strand:+ start:1901 stop:5377 length:3477 start_codon:yes stop_codon:yes gene_type:complete